MRLLWLCVALIACGGSSEPAMPCDGAVIQQDNEGSAHVPVGTSIEYQANPPTSGPHYPVWLAWQEVYADPIAREYYVHNLEHGGIAFLTRCAEGQDCPALDELRAVAEEMPADSRCSAPLTARWVVVSDPELPEDRPIAAAAWDWNYTASCVDAESLASFAVKHVGRGPEDTCANGTMPAP